LRPFGKFSLYFEYFFPFWYVLARKIWQSRKASENLLLI
jgi:hypothetical protein